MPSGSVAVPRGPVLDVRVNGPPPPRHRDGRDEAKVRTEPKKNERTGFDRDRKQKKEVRGRSEHGRVSTRSEHGRVSTRSRHRQVSTGHRQVPIDQPPRNRIDMSLDDIIIESSPRASPPDGKGGGVGKPHRSTRKGAKAVADAARQAAPLHGGKGRPWDDARGRARMRSPERERRTASRASTNSGSTEYWTWMPKSRQWPAYYVCYKTGCTWDESKGGGKGGGGGGGRNEGLWLGRGSAGSKRIRQSRGGDLDYDPADRSNQPAPHRSSLGSTGASAGSSAGPIAGASAGSESMAIEENWGPDEEDCVVYMAASLW